MSYLVVVTFDNQEEASKVRKTLRSEQHSGLISLDDSAVVVRDEEGKYHVKDELDRGVKVGAVGGGFLGLVIGGLLFPIGGLILGALGGAAVGALARKGIEKKFIEDVKESMEPGSSAIIFISREDRPDAAVATFRPYKGKVFYSNLSDEDEKALRQELKDRLQ
ncbi:MAG: DUF1269 domain-containing protein [Anaerolineales bacterium]|jgi:uncharacterized membrane protein